MASTKHVELEPAANGSEQWAEIYDRPAAEKVQKVHREMRRRLNTLEEFEIVYTTVLEMTQSWQVYDEDGAAIALNKPGLLRAPGDIVSGKLFKACLEVVQDALPNL